MAMPTPEEIDAAAQAIYRSLRFVRLEEGDLQNIATMALEAAERVREHKAMLESRRTADVETRAPSGPLRQLRARIGSLLARVRRRLPYLVWFNDEVDVRVAFPMEAVEKVDIVETVRAPLRSEDGSDDSDEAVQLLMDVFNSVDRGAFGEIHQTFAEMGITFMRTFGSHGRTWQWDETLEGPISVRFRGRASKPKLRRARPRPRLVSTTNPDA
jgi:hypothetical protein